MSFSSLCSSTFFPASTCPLACTRRNSPNNRAPPGSFRGLLSTAVQLLRPDPLDVAEGRRHLLLLHLASTQAT